MLLNLVECFIISLFKIGLACTIAGSILKLVPIEVC